MTHAEHSQKHWNALLKQLRQEFPVAAPHPPEDDLTGLLVRGLLLWEASSHQAELAHQRLRSAFVDLNELRVSMPDDIAQALGERYPLAEERSIRIRAVLHDVFAREHAVSIERLRAAPKRDARHYLVSLDGCPEFASAYVVLHGLDGHAAPVDERLLALLIKAGVVRTGTQTSAVSSWIEHYVPSDECASTCALLRAWADRDGHPPHRERRASHVPPQDHTPSRPASRAAAKTRKPGSGKRGQSRP